MSQRVAWSGFIMSQKVCEPYHMNQLELNTTQTSHAVYIASISSTFSSNTFRRHARFT